MNDPENPLFLTTLARTFSEAIADTGIQASGQDAYEVFRSGLGGPLSRESLAAMTDADIDSVKAACDAFFEQDAITGEHISRAVEEALRHWTR